LIWLGGGKGESSPPLPLSLSARCNQFWWHDTFRSAEYHPCMISRLTGNLWRIKCDKCGISESFLSTTRAGLITASHTAGWSRGVSRSLLCWKSWSICPTCSDRVIPRGSDSYDIVTLGKGPRHLGYQRNWRPHCGKKPAGWYLGIDLFQFPTVNLWEPCSDRRSARRLRVNDSSMGIGQRQIRHHRTRSRSRCWGTFWSFHDIVFIRWRIVLHGCSWHDRGRGGSRQVRPPEEGADVPKRLARRCRSLLRRSVVPNQGETARDVRQPLRP